MNTDRPIIPSCQMIFRDGQLMIVLPSSVTITDAKILSQVDNEIENQIRLHSAEDAEPEVNKVIIDFCNVSKYDTFLPALLRTIEYKARDFNIKPEFTNLSNKLSSYLDLLYVVKEENPPRAEKHFFVNHISEIGKYSIDSLNDLREFIEFQGNLFLSIFKIPFNFKKVRWRDLPYQLTRSGINSVPIVFLILFLIGLITGYQGALQLKQFGADIYIADLVGVSITRELSPLMTAILIAGRSGSSFAAEIGTMKVSEEIDALDSMGFDKFNFLILPRVISVVIAMPILVLMADLAGIFGGLISAMGTLEITLSTYVNQMQLVLTLWDVFSGVIKAAVFGFLISAIGCFKGLKVSGGAQSVGIFTTSSVVTSVLFIIITDAIFIFFFQALGV